MTTTCYVSPPALIFKMTTVNLTYFVHGTTTDNEKGIATGWNPGELSARGKEQSAELNELIKNKKFDAVFCSDLKRAVDSARLIFENVEIIQDKRLRECNYGDLNGAEAEKVEALTLKHIDKSFPNGESYKDVEKRIRSFLNNLIKQYPKKSVAVVAHRAPQLALEVITKNKSWEQAIKDDWRLKQPRQWQPGWKYQFKE